MFYYLCTDWERDRIGLFYAQNDVRFFAAYNRQAKLIIGRAELYSAIIRKAEVQKLCVVAPIVG